MFAAVCILLVVVVMNHYYSDISLLYASNNFVGFLCQASRQDSVFIQKAGGPGHLRIRGRLLRLFTPYEAIFAIWNMDAGIGRSSAQRICIGLEPS